MGLEQIWDAAARQAALVSGIKGAYASGAGGQGATVRVIPDGFSDTPVVEVVYEGTELEPGSSEVLIHTFSLRVWMSRSDIGTAVKTLAPMLERFITAYRANLTLFGTANGGAWITGSSGFVESDIGEQPFLYQDITLQAQDKRNVTYT